MKCSQVFCLGCFISSWVFKTTDVFYIVYGRLKNRAGLVCIFWSHFFNLLTLTLADKKDYWSKQHIHRHTHPPSTYYPPKKKKKYSTCFLPHSYISNKLSLYLPLEKHSWDLYSTYLNLTHSHSSNEQSSPSLQENPGLALPRSLSSIEFRRKTGNTCENQIELTKPCY